MSDRLTDLIIAEQRERDAHWAAHPLPHPTVNGRPLQIGDRVRLTENNYRGATGIVTTIRVRCFGIPRDEDIKGPGFKVIGSQPMQQMWIELDGRNGIYYPDDIVEVIE